MPGLVVGLALRWLDMAIVPGDGNDCYPNCQRDENVALAMLIGATLIWVGLIVWHRRHRRRSREG